MRILVVPILKNRWAYYCHSTLPTTSRLTKFVNWTGSKWDKFGEADPTSWKGRLFKTGNNFMDRMDYEEWFLKGVPIKEDLEHELTKVSNNNMVQLGTSHHKYTVFLINVFKGSCAPSIFNR